MIIIDKDTGYNLLYYPQVTEPFPFVPWTMQAYINTLKMNGSASKQYINAQEIPIAPATCVGTFVETFYNQFGIFFGKWNNTDIYRGQNRDYPTFIPSSKRYNINKEEDKVRYCIDWMKKQTFLELFKTSPFYERCRKFQISGAKFEFDLEAVAQHYEFISDYIDITTNLNTALFFAYTYKDDNGAYHPIQDFSKYEPTIYHADLVDIYEKYKHKLKIIGFQALMRPYTQRAMALDVTNDEDYKQAFKKITMPKDPVLAKGIFDSCQNGAVIFPPVDKMAQCANDVRNCNSINEKFFEQYLEQCNEELRITKEDLIKAGIVLDGMKWQLSEFFKYEMNRELDDDMLIFLNNHIDVQTVMRV